ncbi:hypothetical protein EAI25_11075 [Akkermansia muciniphila]|nr:hypothetical protein [Akkermansia muciniphila]
MPDTDNLFAQIITNLVAGTNLTISTILELITNIWRVCNYKIPTIWGYGVNTRKSICIYYFCIWEIVSTTFCHRSIDFNCKHFASSII